MRTFKISSRLFRRAVFSAPREKNFQRAAFTQKNFWVDGAREFFLFRFAL